MAAMRQGSIPVATYEQGLQWLFTYSPVEEWAFASGDYEAELPLEAKLLAAMFWRNESALVRDVRRIWNSALGADTPPPPARRPRFPGWR